MEVLMTFLERHQKNMARVWNQAMGQRVGNRDAPLWKILQIAHEQGIKSTELPYIPEKDEWVYKTTRYGEEFESQVSICHTFVCKVMKHAGIFDQFNVNFDCNELSLYDLLKMKIFDSDFQRPQQCV